MHGVKVSLLQKVRTGANEFLAPVFSEIWVDVDDVLIGEPSGEDIVNDLNLYGKRLAYTLGIPKKDNHKWRDTKVKFWGYVFETYGLPTRGAISIGTFYWNRANMLAGKPMIDAYRTSEALSFSGLVFGRNSTAEIHRRCHEMFESHYTHDTSFMRYDVDLPVKTGSGDGLEKLDLVMPELFDVKAVGFDSYVADQFATYGRDLGRPRTRAIIANTLSILHKYT